MSSQSLSCDNLMVSRTSLLYAMHAAAGGILTNLGLLSTTLINRGELHVSQAAPAGHHNLTGVLVGWLSSKQ